MLIQYVSDLHLEFRGTNFKNLIKPTGDVLIMAGDISAMGTKSDFNNFIKFLKFITPQFKYVLHVAGNHEFYYSDTKGTKNIQCTMQYINKKLKLLESHFNNYKYLDCETITLTINKKKYAFIGASLWAKVCLKDRDKIQKGMNDYNFIYMEDKSSVRKYNITDMQKMYRKHYKYIKDTLEKNKESKTPFILITHHKPVDDTNSAESDIYTQAYESNTYKILKKPIKLAIHGHTHKHYDKTINGIRYVSNPLGYILQPTGFINDLVIKI